MLGTENETGTKIIDLFYELGHHIDSHKRDDLTRWDTIFEFATDPEKVHAELADVKESWIVYTQGIPMGYDKYEAQLAAQHNPEFAAWWRKAVEVYDREG
jgi:hypothetical protein